MKPKRGRWLAVGAATVVGIAIATVLPASAEAVDPVEDTGNPTCGEGLTSFKIDSPTAGPHSDGTLEVTLNFNSPDEGQTVDWTSNIPVQVVIVKGSSSANVYDYGPDGISADTGLHAPTVESGKYADVSHITFCYVVENGTTTTTTTSTTSTTTTVPGATTTTVPGATTTTVAPGATTTMAPSPAPAVPPAPTAQPVTAVPTFTG